MKLDDIPYTSRRDGRYGRAHQLRRAAKKEAKVSRRRFIGMTAATGAVAAVVMSGLDRGAQMAKPAWAGSSCDPSDITKIGNGTLGPCDPNNNDDYPYAVNDNCNGCDGVHRSDYYCVYESLSGFDASHRICGQGDASQSKTFKFRTNDCWVGLYDGWQWWTNQDNNCGCGSAGLKKFSCNDGYTYQTGQTTKSTICMKGKCGP